jgi:hypothetical protein
MEVIEVTYGRNLEELNLRKSIMEYRDSMWNEVVRIKKQSYERMFFEGEITSNEYRQMSNKNE